MRRYRRRKKFNFLIPFLIIIFVGVVGVLSLQFWNSFWVSQKGDAVFYLVDGRAKIMPYGSEEWENLYNGVRIKLGDKLQVMGGGRGLLKFYDGTQARMSDNTILVLEDITKNAEDQQILLGLTEGQVWVNKPKKSGVIRKTDFVINTEFAAYSITGTVFNLERSNSVDTLRVLNGEVSVDILEVIDGKKRSIAQQPVGVGQESKIDEAVMKAFTSRQTLSFKQALDPNFQTTEWFIWNTEEDENPTDYSNPNARKPIIPVDLNSTPEANTVDGETDDKDQVDIDATTTTDKDKEPDTANENAMELKKPEVLKVGAVDYQEGLIVKTDNFALSGTISGVDAVFVNNYKLSKFKKGDTEWSYNMAERFQNLKSGVNKIEVYGTTEGGEKTPVLEFSFEYQPPKKPTVIAPIVTRSASQEVRSSN